MKLSDLKKLISKNKPFKGSKSYWEKRYASGGDSGHGSFNKLAQFKADIINKIVEEHDVYEVIEFGCGDGNQLKLYDFPNYLGLDISEVAIKKCRKLFNNDGNKSFELMENYNNSLADLALSIDVIYHLVEEEVYKNYLKLLFNGSSNLVVIYSSNEEVYNPEFPHVKHRLFSEYVKKEFSDYRMIQHIPNKYPFDSEVRESSRADFFIYRKNT